MPEQRSTRACAQGDYNLGADKLELQIEPPLATVDLACRGFLMDPPLSARHIFEVLDGVCHVDLRPIHARCCKSLDKHPPGGPYEGAPLAVLLVSRLLTYEHHVGGHRAFAEYRLRTQPIERTARA
jgi:hypothetical protein